MGTTWSVTIAESAPETVRAEIEAELDQVVQEMSHWNPRSDVSRYNTAAAGEWVKMPPEAFGVLRQALALAKSSQGAFDPTIGALVNTWGFGPAESRRTPPTDAEINEAMAQVGWQRLSVDEEQHRVQQPGGVTLDLSSSAEGFAVDELARVLERHGLSHYLIDLGGELRAAGHKADGEPWRVVVGEDDGEGRKQSAPFVLRDCALSTSGDSQHYFVDAGVRYSHLLDARTGRPVTHGLIAVSVVAPTTIEADQWSTLLAVLGPKHGRAYAKQHGIAARFVERRARDNPRVRTVGGFPACPRD